MHDTFSALLELHEVNNRQQLLIKERKAREAKLTQATEAYKSAVATREKAAEEAERSDALIRQYGTDIERCDSTIAKLREQQMQARTNKEYLACINGVENAKAEKRLREESLRNLHERIDELKEQLKRTEEAEEAAKATMETAERELGEQQEEAESEAELERIYSEKKQGVDPKFLEVYERLISARHPMPLMKVDLRTGATPMGNRLNTQALEQLRLGQLVTDSASNAILYVEEEEQESV